MSTQDKTLAALVELGEAAARRTRSDQIQHALHTALQLTDADAAIALAVARGWLRDDGERVVPTELGYRFVDDLQLLFVPG